MNTAAIVAGVLVFAVLLGVVRSRHASRHRTLRIGLQIAAAVLLYFSLFPPTLPERFASDELIVLTPGTTPAQLAELSPAASVVALPGVDAGRAIERTPDLGTALRRHADARRLRIVGGGLPARDIDAARGLVAAFDAAPLPHGVIELEIPGNVSAGSVWRIGGRVEGVEGGRVELRDPSGAVVATRALDAQGRFDLRAAAKGEGAVLFALNVLDRDGARIDAVTVPLAARANVPPRILLLAGAPDAELKYLRRWAADAGLAADSRMILSEGVTYSEGTPALDGDTLRRTDIAIVDERAWAALDAQSKKALVAAVRDGLGLLLRVTGPLPVAVAAEWAELGYRLEPIEPPPAVRIDGLLSRDDTGLIFSHRAFAVTSPDAASLLRADDGSTLAWSRNLGSGRVALWLLADSYKLSLGGASAAFGTLWGDALAAVARTRGTAPPSLPTTARIDERAVLCGVTDAAAFESTTGTHSELIVDATTHCAAYWPDTAGWHTLLNGGMRWPFYVRSRDEAHALAASDTARATRALVGETSSAMGAATRDRPLPRWPFFLAWLAVAAALWWLERGRVAKD